nr:discoidin domain-containing protein [Thermoguttaceae bacterium]
MRNSVKNLFFALLMMLTLTAGAWAGTQLSDLMGGDVTDPGNKIQVPTSYTDPTDWETRYADATWLSIRSYQKGPYETNECPSNLFNNQVGGGTYKWFDSFGPSASNPAYVTLQFPEAFVLTHFTLTSGNDSMNSRNPKDWSLYASNDGLTWTPIYHATSTADFTETINTTVLYSSFTYADGNITSDTVLNDSQKAAVSASLGSEKTISTSDFSTPGAYSWYRLQINSTSGGGATQLGELELFGNKVSSGRTSGNPFLPTYQLMNHVGSVYSLDAQNAESLTVDANNKVSAWGDSNSNGIEFRQATTDFQPTLSTITINGQEFNALEFTKVTQTSENP